MPDSESFSEHFHFSGSEEISPQSESSKVIKEHWEKNWNSQAQILN